MEKSLKPVIAFFFIGFFFTPFLAQAQDVSEILPENPKDDSFIEKATYQTSCNDFQVFIDNTTSDYFYIKYRAPGEAINNKSSTANSPQIKYAVISPVIAGYKLPFSIFIENLTDVISAAAIKTLKDSTKFDPVLTPENTKAYWVEKTDDAKGHEGPFHGDAWVQLTIYSDKEYKNPIYEVTLVKKKQTINGTDKNPIISNGDLIPTETPKLPPTDVSQYRAQYSTIYSGDCDKSIPGYGQITIIRK